MSNILLLALIVHFIHLVVLMFLTVYSQENGEEGCLGFALFIFSLFVFSLCAWLFGDGGSELERIGGFTGYILADILLGIIWWWLIVNPWRYFHFHGSRVFGWRIRRITAEKLLRKGLSKGTFIFHSWINSPGDSFCRVEKELFTFDDYIQSTRFMTKEMRSRFYLVQLNE